MIGDDGEILGEQIHNRRATLPEQRLYQAKIIQHVQDLNGPNDDQARRFLRTGNPDFRQFCEGAGWEPEWVVAGLGKIEEFDR